MNTEILDGALGLGLWTYPGKRRGRLAGWSLFSFLAVLLGFHWLWVTSAIGQELPSAAGAAKKVPDNRVLEGDFGPARIYFGAEGNGVQGRADFGDVYRRNAGETVRLLRAAGEAALEIRGGADIGRTVEAAVGTGGMRRLGEGEFARVGAGGDRRIAIVQSDELGRSLNANVLARVDGVAGVLPVYVDPESGGRMISSGEVIVGLRPGVTLAEMEAGLKAVGLELVERVGSPRLNSYLFRQTDLTRSSLAVSDQLFEDARVAWAAPNFIRETKRFAIPNDPLFPRQQHLHNTGQKGGVADADVDAAEAWDVSQGSSSVVIAIIDDGVDTAHADLTIYNNPGETGGGKESNGIDDDGNGLIDDYRGWDFANNDNNPNPVGVNGHGTACAGVAAARMNNGYRTAGIAPNCKILPVKIAGDNGLATTDANIGTAISYAADHADVLSNSWGGGAPSAFIDAAITDASVNGRGGKGCPVFFANGNRASAWGRVFFAVGRDLGAGTFSFGFRFAKDGMLSAGEDLMRIDNVALLASDQYSHVNTALGAGGRQDFEGVFPPSGWLLSSSGGANWFVTGDQTYGGTGGVRSPRSGATGNNGWCELRTPNIPVAVDELLGMQLYISSEANYDGFLLRVYNAAGTFLGSYGLVSGIVTPFTPVAYPANHPSAISVGASTDSDRRGDYSEYGPETDFLAPSNGGWNEITTLDPTGTAGANSSDFRSLFGGTSAATPLAAGVGALVLSVNPDLTGTQVRDAMRQTADKIGPVPYTGGFNNEYGYGRVNARAALDYVKPLVSVAALDPNAGEPSDSGSFVITRTGSAASSLTVNFAVGGTAQAGSDYLSLGSSVVIPAGSASATLVVTPVDDAVFEGSESVILTLAAAAPYGLGSPSIATVTIADNDVFSEFLTVDNVDGPSRVQLAGNWSASSSVAGYWGVNYLQDGNGGKGSKTATFIPTVGTPGNYDVFIRYTSGANRASNVPIDITHSSGVQTVSLNQRVGGGAWVLLGTFHFNAGTAGRVRLRTTATDGFVIADAIRLIAAVPALPVVTVAASNPNAAEPNEPSRFTFSRTGLASDPLTVNFSVGGAAAEGIDYGTIGGSITFDPGAITADVAVNPIDDPEVEPAETVAVTLAGGEGYIVGDPSLATVYISDNDGVVDFLTVDNASGPTRVELAGAWSTSASTPGYWGADYLHDGNAGKGAKTATFIPTVAATGNYEVFLFYPAAPNRASNLPVDIIHAGGTTTATVNQRINGNQWVSLGIHAFNSGTAGRVRLRTTGTDGFVIADAVRLVAAGVAQAAAGFENQAAFGAAKLAVLDRGRAGVITNVRFGPKGAIVVVASDAGVTYRLEGSNDLVEWRALDTRVAAGAEVEFADPDAGAHSQRYYRVTRLGSSGSLR